MERISCVRVFDPHCLGWTNHWVVLTAAGCFLVPSERGGWEARVPFHLDRALPELDASYVEPVWDLLTRPKWRVGA